MRSIKLKLDEAGSETYEGRFGGFTIVRASSYSAAVTITVSMRGQASPALGCRVRESMYGGDLDAVTVEWSAQPGEWVEIVLTRYFADARGLRFSVSGVEPSAGGVDDPDLIPSSDPTEGGYDNGNSDCVCALDQMAAVTLFWDGVSNAEIDGDYYVGGHLFNEAFTVRGGLALWPADPAVSFGGSYGGGNPWPSGQSTDYNLFRGVSADPVGTVEGYDLHVQASCGVLCSTGLIRFYVWLDTLDCDFPAVIDGDFTIRQLRGAYLFNQAHIGDKLGVGGYSTCVKYAYYYRCPAMQVELEDEAKMTITQYEALSL